MITLHDISRLAAGGESEAVEFKATTGQRSEAARTLSAMLNGRGGRVLFGVQSDGSVTGQQASDRTLEKITRACEEDVRPRHPPSVGRFPIPLPGGKGLEVLVAEVPKGTRRPYSCRGIYYMRSGSSTVVMPADKQALMILERHHSTDRWELETSHRGLDAINGDEVRAFRDEAIAARRAGFDADASVVDILRAMSLLDGEGSPNRGAVALFGRSEAFTGQYPTLGCRLVAVPGTVSRRGVHRRCARAGQRFRLAEAGDVVLREASAPPGANQRQPPRRGRSGDTCRGRARGLGQRLRSS